ncbi:MULTISPECIES: hypothetical protein [unclassified Marinimicrobium]|jgi:hypothetical protein|uniref:hypothetical protein n=1 Tax=Marinimicrobium TaxID=359337 RepID=UPI000C50AB26|nr:MULTISPECIES: hypothetical protein [unclassified Marinimicrobium]MAN50543.1 hypothetical protein [Marinimicrobium sp.]|tara:strand:- start:427 stop:954 length:528 start_codon:yes stop_codon:yes gene_type:complete
MCESLWPQLRLKADTEKELIAKYRQVYHETYVWDENGERRVFTDWTGCRYQFSERAFNHAFSEAKNHRTSSGIHDNGWSRKRLRRILWIREVLKLSAGTIQRYAQTRKTDRGRQAKRRTLVVVEERYVVVFDDPKEKGKPHQFVTAFPADRSYMEQIKRTSFLVETKVGAKKQGG